MKRAVLFTLFIFLTSVIVLAQQEMTYEDEARMSFVVSKLYEDAMLRVHGYSPAVSETLIDLTAIYAYRMHGTERAGHDLMTWEERWDYIYDKAPEYGEQALFDLTIQENTAFRPWIMTDPYEVLSTWNESKPHFDSIFQPGVVAYAWFVSYHNGYTYIVTTVARVRE